MIVVYSDERRRFEAITSYMERNLPRVERWRWDSAVQRWWAPSEDIARRLASYAQGSASLRLASLTETERTALADSQAEDADLAIPSPPGLDYLPYQRAGIAYALKRGNVLIADEMGLGKTIQAIGVANVLAAMEPAGALVQRNGYSCGSERWNGSFPVRVPDGLSRALIICPASLRLNWRAEWRRWHTGRLRPTLLDTWPGGLFDATVGKALIVSYDSVRKWHPMIASVEWDVLILDEAHLVKDDSTRRAKTILGGKHHGTTYEPLRARRTLALTGTPIVNRPQELWPLVKLLAPSGLGKSKADFTERYGSYYGNQSSQLAELHLRLRSQIMVRRLKADVLKQLPAKRRQIVLLDVAGGEGIVAAEQRALDAQRALLEKTREGIDGLPHAEQVMRLRQCRAMALSEIARIRHETALAKLPAAIEHVSEVLGNVEKLVIFSHHHDVVDGLAEAFRRISVVLDGRVEQQGRQAAVDAFQQDRRVRLFLGSIRAAGLGITLTAASVVIFVELDWTPAAMMQSEDRLHRIGQVNPVLVQHLVIDGSIDAKMAKILIDKQQMMDAALDGGRGEAAQRDILSEVLRA